MWHHIFVCQLIRWFVLSREEIIISSNGLQIKTLKQDTVEQSGTIWRMYGYLINKCYVN